MSTTTQKLPGLRHLYRCVRSLGVSLGWRYWKVSRQCALHPEKASIWAFNCRLAATEIDISGGDPQIAEVLRLWADEVDAHKKLRDLS